MRFATLLEDCHPVLSQLLEQQSRGTKMINSVADVRAWSSKCMSPYFGKSPSEVSKNNHKIKVYALNKLCN